VPVGGVNWTPIIQGALTGLAQSFGAQVTFPTQAKAPVEVPVAPTLAQAGAVSTPAVNLAPLESRLNNLESKLGTLETTMAQLRKSKQSKREPKHRGRHSLLLLLIL
jgi:hypothetical protein